MKWMLTLMLVGLPAAHADLVEGVSCAEMMTTTNCWDASVDWSWAGLVMGVGGFAAAVFAAVRAMRAGLVMVAVAVGGTFFALGVTGFGMFLF